jgi:hypothetical protein
LIIYRLSHVRSGLEHVDDEGFHLGSYSTRERAENAIAILRTKPGFKDFPDDFVIDEELVDQIHWQDGFVNDGLQDLANEVAARKESSRDAL